MLLKEKIIIGLNDVHVIWGEAIGFLTFFDRNEIKESRGMQESSRESRRVEYG